MNKRVKYYKNSTVALISIVCLAIFISIIYIKTIFPSPVSKHDMENEFIKNKDMLLSVAKFLENQEYTSIYITPTHEKGEMFASTNAEKVGKSINISDASISDNIADLFEKNNYNIISKELSVIYFQIWSNRDYGRGIVYSIDGERPQNGLITKLEPLTEENWYFYEEK